MSVTHLAAQIPVHPDSITKYEKADRWPARDIAEKIDNVLQARGVLLAAWQDADGHRPQARTMRSSRHADATGWDHDPRRRAFLPAAAAVLSGPSAVKLLDAVLGLEQREHAGHPPGISEIAQQVAQAKTAYQACRYDSALSSLPRLLESLTAAQGTGVPADAARVHGLAADTYHLVGSLLLKLGDAATALLAADRSQRHAKASGDPVAAAASARIVTHALARTGHAERAARLAHQAAIDLDDASSLATTDAVAVYGALVLRGATAAARSGNHDSAECFLEQAARAASRLGREGNARWTGFGPANVDLHRVNVALTLGEAGRAIQFARLVRHDQLLSAERRVSLFLDVAQAYALGGRHESALGALHTAARIAPQEVRNRPAVHGLVRGLCTHASASVRTRAAAFASAAGISA